VHVTGNGAGSADLSSLDDGSISISIKATDAAGNTANGTGDSLTLDTSADLGTALAVTADDSSINNSEKAAVGFTVAGLDGDAEADVTFSDGTNPDVVVHVTGNGAGSADLTSLDDGSISISIKATDNAGNTANGTGDSLTLDTSADLGTALAVTADDNSINNSEKAAVGFTVAGLDGDAEADVTFSDGNNPDVIVHVTGN